MNVTLLRHGRTRRPGIYAGTLDVALDATGLASMQRAVETLDVARVITSPSSRCRVFAAAFAASRGLPLTVDSAWREMDFGAWEGHTARDILARDPQPLQDFWNDPEQHGAPGGESLAALRRRVVRAWDALERGTDTLIVTHGGPLRLLFQHLLGLDTDGVWRIDPNPGARIDFVADADGVRLRRFDPGTGAPPEADKPDTRESDIGTRAPENRPSKDHDPDRPTADRPQIQIRAVTTMSPNATHRGFRSRRCHR